MFQLKLILKSYCCIVIKNNYTNRKCRFLRDKYSFWQKNLDFPFVYFIRLSIVKLKGFDWISPLYILNVKVFGWRLFCFTFYFLICFQICKSSVYQYISTNFEFCLCQRFFFLFWDYLNSAHHFVYYIYFVVVKLGWLQIKYIYLKSCKLKWKMLWLCVFFIYVCKLTESCVIYCK